MKDYLSTIYCDLRSFGRKLKHQCLTSCYIYNIINTDVTVKQLPMHAFYNVVLTISTLYLGLHILMIYNPEYIMNRHKTKHPWCFYSNFQTFQYKALMSDRNNLMTLMQKFIFTLRAKPPKDNAFCYYGNYGHIVCHTDETLMQDIIICCDSLCWVLWGNYVLRIL